MGHRVAQIAAGDPQSTRLVYALVIALILVGLLLVFLAVWMIHRTKADLELLGPLERMGDSKWRKRDLQRQQALLDEVRPAGAARPIPTTVSISPDPAGVPATAEFPPPAAPVLAVVEPAAASDPDAALDASPDVEPTAAPDGGVPLGSVVEPATETTVEPVVEAEPERVVEADPEPVTATEPEPVVESDVESITGSDDEAPVEPAVEG